MLWNYREYGQEALLPILLRAYRFCKPKVRSSIPLSGTNVYNGLADFSHRAVELIGTIGHKIFDARFPCPITAR
jgi:hypothetical protein